MCYMYRGEYAAVQAIASIINYVRIPASIGNKLRLKRQRRKLPRNKNCSGEAAQRLSSNIYI